jgi:xylulokinase
MKVQPFILVYDAGTSSLKAVVYDDMGRIITKRSLFYDYETPEEGWAEIDPERWWLSLLSVTADLRSEGVDLGKLRGIALTGQMHSAVLLDAGGQILGPSILWLDRRASVETVELQQHFKLPPYKLNSSYTLPKLYWQSRHQPQLLARTATILWPKDYLRYRLTGVRATDYTEGIGAALLNWESREWAPERIRFCGMNPEVLPEILPQETTFTLHTDVAKALGFSGDCLVLNGCGDIAALLGGAPYRPGRLVYSLGSSSMYFADVPESKSEAEGLYSLDIAGYRLFGGVSSTTGASLKWAHDTLWGGEDGAPFESMISQVLAEPVKNDHLLFFPFLAGERSPFWSDTITGGFEGLKLHHTRIQLTRAVMEGTAFSLRYILDLMERANVSITEIALAGGGARTKGWPEMIAAVTGKPVLVYNAEETVTTVLYAMMAGVLKGQAFRTVLDSLFADPRQIVDDGNDRLRYRSLYDRYTRYLAMKTAIEMPASQ